MSKATPGKRAKATPKKVKPAGDGEGGESPSVTGKKVGEKGGKAKAKVKTDEEDGAVDSVEGPHGVALGDDFDFGS